MKLHPCRFILVGILLGLNSLAAAESLGAQVKTIEAVGDHYPIFKVEKNINPQNQMVVYTKLNSQCGFVLTESKLPVFDYYWLMDRKNYKQVFSAIRSQIQNRLAVSFDPTTATLAVTISDLKELETDLKYHQISVTTHQVKDSCIVQATLPLGPSDHNATMKVDSIYTEGQGYYHPKVISVTLKGSLTATGKAFQRTYNSSP